MDYSRAVRAPRGAVVTDVTSEDRTVTIEATSDSKVLDVLDALLKKVGCNNLAGIQPRGRGSYDVAFRTPEAYRDALAWDLAQDNSCLRTVAAANGLTRVRVLSTPMHWQWAPLIDALAEFGEVRQYFFETFQGYPNIRNGTRVVLMKLDPKKTLEDALKVEHFMVRIDYPGVQRSCFYCHKPGHMVRDCPKKAAMAEPPVPSSSETVVQDPVPMETVVVPSPVVVSSEASESRGSKRKDKEEGEVDPDAPYQSAEEAASIMDFDDLVIMDPDHGHVPSLASWGAQMDAAMPLASLIAGSSGSLPTGDSTGSRPESRRVRKKEVKNLKSSRTSSPSTSPPRTQQPSSSK